MQINKLFTIFLSFSDHLVGIDQHEAETAEEALKQFIKSAEALEGYDRELLLKSLMPLIHIAHEKGIWSYYFDPDLMDIEWPGDNAVLGGHIVQTDPNGLVRKESS